MVAVAAPDAPMPAETSTMSRPILMTHAIATNIRGLLESPRPLRIPDMALYPNMKNMPHEHMNI